MEQPPKKTAACLCAWHRNRMELHSLWTKVALAAYQFRPGFLSGRNLLCLFHLVSTYAEVTIAFTWSRCPKDDSINQWPRCIWRGNCPEVKIVTQLFSVVLQYFWHFLDKYKSLIFHVESWIHICLLELIISSCGDTQSLMILAVDSFYASWCFWESACLVVYWSCGDPVFEGWVQACIRYELLKRDYWIILWVNHLFSKHINSMVRPRQYPTYLLSMNVMQQCIGDSNLFDIVCDWHWSPKARNKSITETFCICTRTNKNVVQCCRIIMIIWIYLDFLHHFDPSSRLSEIW